jgi:hypothetical protein
VLGACALWCRRGPRLHPTTCPLLRTLALERVDGRRLVAMVAGKAMAAVCIALPLGLIAGRWLLQIATRLVAVSATSGLPNPPLRLDVPWITVAALVGCCSLRSSRSAPSPARSRHARCRKKI